MSENNDTAVAVKEEKEKAVEFVPFGAKDSIRLSAAMVRNFIAVPTRSGALPTERDCIRFIMLCRGKRANPFEGDCYLIGYDAQTGPTFSLVCGIELFLKRAEASADYDGNEAGVIVQAEGGMVTERQGALVMKGETIVGGWAKVYRKNHNRPEYKSVKFETYSTGRSRWEKDPGGMIAKVALSQALRAAYPTALGGLYVREEMERVTETGGNVADVRTPVAMPVAKSKKAEAKPEPEQAPKEDPQQGADTEAEPEEGNQAPTAEEAEKIERTLLMNVILSAIDADRTKVENAASACDAPQVAFKKIRSTMDKWETSALRKLVETIALSK